MGQSNHYAKMKIRAQVTLELTLGILLLATIFFFAMSMWQRIIKRPGNTEGIIPTVRSFVNERLGLLHDPNNISVGVDPDEPVDLTNLDTSIATLNTEISALQTQQATLLTEAQQKRSESLDIRTNEIEHDCWFGYCPGYWYPEVDWQLSRAKMYEAVAKEDAAAMLQKSIDRLTYQRDQIQYARDLLAQGTEESVAQARGILDSLQPEPALTSEQQRHLDAQALRSEADALDTQAQSLVAQAGDHWSDYYNRNCWGDRDEAISDEGLYEEAEVKSSIVDPLHDGTEIQGLAQMKRTEADRLDGIYGIGDSQDTADTVNGMNDTIDDDTTNSEAEDIIDSTPMPW